MNEEEKRANKFSAWLEKLQEDSWQLELLVSGFAIYLLYESYDFSTHVLQDFLVMGNREANMQELFMIVIMIFILGLRFMLFNMVMHMILRGLWIGALGLRYVSGEIAYDDLKYASSVRTYLSKKVGSFDAYIQRLEKVCSIIFAFSFLLFFSLISFGTIIVFTTLLNVLINYLVETLLGFNAELLLMIVNWMLGVGGLLYFIDFITLGLLKRNAKVFRFYKPIYLFFGWLSLAFIYRPIYYNFVDDRFSKRVGLLIFPYIIMGLFIFSLSFNNYHYFPTDISIAEFSSKDRHRIMEASHYDDLRLERLKISDDWREEYMYVASIPSRIIKDDVLPVFLEYEWQDEKAIKQFCPDLEPLTQQDFFSVLDDLTGVRPMMKKRLAEEDYISSLVECFPNICSIIIDDSLQYKPTLFLQKSITSHQRGFQTMLDISTLSKGMHTLSVKKYEIDRKDSVLLKTKAIIPFWKQ